MNLEPFNGPGSTPSRRRFWDQVTNAVNASRKIPGQFVTVDEHPDTGSVINVADSETRRGGGGFDCSHSISVSFSGVTLCSGCLDATPFGFGYSMNNLIATGTINDTFVLPPFDNPCEGDCMWFMQTDDNRINYDLWFSPGCSGDPDLNQSQPLAPIVVLRGGLWIVWLFDAVSRILFRADNISVLTGIPNTVECAMTAKDVTPCEDPQADDFVIASGGTATITLL